jgi:hypothetical protein
MKASIRKNSVEYKVAVSWVLHSIKNVMGYDIVRKSILKHFIPGIQNLSDSTTFSGMEEDYAKITGDYILNIATQKKPYVVFTIANPALEENNLFETHYQFIYVDNVNHIIYSIDPASVYNPDTGKVIRGVWRPEASEGMITYLKKHNHKIHGHKYRFQFVKTSHPAQTSEDDVFCQTWSLMLMIEFINKTLENPSFTDYSQIVINIPENEHARYQKIVDFYHLVTDIPVIDNPREKICDVLTEEYQRELKNRKSTIIKNSSVDMYDKLIKTDPCLVMKQLTVADIYNW